MTRKWEFNKEVARDFDYIADTSIPKYRVIIHKTVRILNNLSRDSKIIDVGCATGNTLGVLKNRGFTNVWGVDSSESMLEKAKQRGYDNLYNSPIFPIELFPFDAVIANWTLHFIKPLERYEYIKDIYFSLNSNGIFILSEKTDENQEEYLKFKKSNFLTDEEIREKTESLKGILITKPISWYEDVLKDVGFKQIEIIDHTYCFVTFLARK
jgi:tRNA (cmo5U34)-methyltransferase